MYSSAGFSIKKLSMEDILQSIDTLMELRAILRHYAPDFTIEEESDRKEIFKKIKKVSKHLVPVFTELGFCLDASRVGGSVPGQSGKAIPQDKGGVAAVASESKQSKEHGVASDVPVARSIVELIDAVGENYLIVSSNSIRDKLKKSGIPAQKIISTGGPISPEDLKKLNPNIPEKALLGYKKKVDSLIQKLKGIVEKGNTLYFAKCPMDESDMLVDARIKELEEKIGAEINIIIVPNWENI